MADVWANSMACHPRATCHIAGCCHLANLMSRFQSYVSHCRVLPLGEFNGMSFQSHVSLPLSEFTVTIPEPHATLQGAVTWQIRCHDSIAMWHIAGCCHWANSMACHPRAMYHIAGCCHPLGEFTVTIPQPHATLQGAVTWRNQCHDNARFQGVKIASAILKIVFRHIYFFVFNTV